MCTLIEDRDLSPAKLSVELEQAVIEHELNKDGSIYVTESGMFPFWINVCKRDGTVILSTHAFFRKPVGHLQQLEFCNEINRKFSLLTAHSDGQRMWVDTALLYKDGLPRECLIRVCRRFSTNLERALALLDPDGSTLFAPGDEEADKDAMHE